VISKKYVEGIIRVPTGFDDPFVAHASRNSMLHKRLKLNFVITGTRPVGNSERFDSLLDMNVVRLRYLYLLEAIVKGDTFMSPVIAENEEEEYESDSTEDSDRGFVWEDSSETTTSESTSEGYSDLKREVERPKFNNSSKTDEDYIVNNNLTHSATVDLADTLAIRVDSDSMFSDNFLICSLIRTINNGYEDLTVWLSDDSLMVFMRFPMTYWVFILTKGTTGYSIKSNVISTLFISSLYRVCMYFFVKTKERVFFKDLKSSEVSGYELLHGMEGFSVSPTAEGNFPFKKLSEKEHKSLETSMIRALNSKTSKQKFTIEGVPKTFFRGVRAGVAYRFPKVVRTAFNKYFEPWNISTIPTNATIYMKSQGRVLQDVPFSPRDSYSSEEVYLFKGEKWSLKDLSNLNNLDVPEHIDIDGPDILRKAVNGIMKLFRLSMSNERIKSFRAMAEQIDLDVVYLINGKMHKNSKTKNIVSDWLQAFGDDLINSKVVEDRVTGEMKRIVYQTASSDSDDSIRSKIFKSKINNTHKLHLLRGELSTMYYGNTASEEFELILELLLG
jgi:hypothetical protein